jgi:hypothetical protein
LLQPGKDNLDLSRSIRNRNMPIANCKEAFPFGCQHVRSRRHTCRERAVSVRGNGSDLLGMDISYRNANARHGSAVLVNDPASDADLPGGNGEAREIEQKEKYAQEPHSCGDDPR